MSRAYDFIKECGVYFVLTVDGDRPAGRPFGAIMEQGNKLYISTDDTKAVYHQIKANPNIQLLAFRADRAWARINAVAEEQSDMATKTLMFDSCPSLKRQIVGPDALHFTVFSLSITSTEINE